MDRQVSQVVESLWQRLHGGLQVIHAPAAILGKLFV